jgi:hypothetical protein
MTLIPRSNVRAVHSSPSFDVLVHFTPAIWLEYGPESADPEITHELANFHDIVARTCACVPNRKPGSESDRQVE